jgi:hypothetical protein
LNWPSSSICLIFIVSGFTAPTQTTVLGGW